MPLAALQQALAAIVGDCRTYIRLRMRARGGACRGCGTRTKRREKQGARRDDAPAFGDAKRPGLRRPRA